MYVIGSLTGDNFVRFVLGSALGVANHLISKASSLYYFLCVRFCIIMNVYNNNNNTDRNIH